jgi:hypothetical protein
MPHRFEKVGNQVIENYKKTYLLSIAAPIISSRLINHDSVRNKVYGWSSLLLSAVTFVLIGTMGVTLNTAYAIFALPIAKIADLINAKKDRPHTQDDLSSMRTILASLYAGDQFAHLNDTELFDLQMTIMQSFENPELYNLQGALNESFADSDNTPSILRTTTNKFSEYSADTQKYLKKMKSHTTFEIQIQALEKVLYKKNDTLSAKEIASLDQFKDPLTDNYMEIPVCLNDKYYDLQVIAKLNKDPFSLEEFTLKKITPAADLLKDFDKLILEIKENHHLLETASQQIFSMK